jgi:enolase
MSSIEKITCHKALNSRGDWTIETHVTLSDGATGSQIVPEGASKGDNEAIYIPADKAVDVVSGVLNDALYGDNPFDQKSIDAQMLEMDGTSDKSYLGANSILSISLAAAKAAANSKNKALYEYLGTMFGNSQYVLPTPLFNVINGGKHANNGLSLQEFMIIPARRISFDKAYEIGATVYKNLKIELLHAGFDIDVGDEGGFAPNGLTTFGVLELLKRAASKKYKIGSEVFFGIDAAAGSFRRMGRYRIPEENLKMSNIELSEYYVNLVNQFEIIYLEDPFHEGDYAAWESFNGVMKDKLLVVGDDLVVTNTLMLEKALKSNMVNSVIVKPNQIGTLTETLDFIRMAKDAELNITISHRSGDNAEDTFIADLAVAVGADFIKAGAPARGERVAKYNRLLEIFGDTET